MFFLLTCEIILLECHIVVKKDGGMRTFCFMKEWMIQIIMATLYLRKVVLHVFFYNFVIMTVLCNCSFL